MVIEQPLKKTFESEGAILERALAKCIRDRQAALRDLADAARRVDKAAFGQQADFGPSHQALLKTLDRAADFILKRCNLAANSLGEPLESGFERNTLICTEYLNMHFNRSASAPFQRISESLRFLGSDFGLSGQFPERRAAVFNLHMPDHRQICR